MAAPPIPTIPLVSHQNDPKIYTFGKNSIEKLESLGFSSSSTSSDIIKKYPNFDILSKAFKNINVVLSNYNKQIFRNIYENQKSFEKIKTDFTPEFQTPNSLDDLKQITQNVALPIQPTPEFSQDKQNLTIDSIGANQSIEKLLLKNKIHSYEVDPLDSKNAISGLPIYEKDTFLGEVDRTDGSKKINDVQLTTNNSKNTLSIVGEIVQQAENNNTDYHENSFLYRKTSEKKVAKQPDPNSNTQYSSNNPSDSKVPQNIQNNTGEITKAPTNYLSKNINNNNNNNNNNQQFNFALEQIKPENTERLLGPRPDKNLVDAQNPDDDSLYDYIPDYKKKLKMDMLWNKGIQPSVKRWKQLNDKSHQIDYANPLEMSTFVDKQIQFLNVEKTSYFPAEYRGNMLSNGKLFGSQAKRTKREIVAVENEARKRSNIENSGDINIQKRLINQHWMYKNPYSIKSYSNTFITTKSYEEGAFTPQYPPTNIAVAF
jgi:hypothetical protein